MSARSQSPARPKRTVTNLSLIIPAFNEAKRLPRTLDAVAAWLASDAAPTATEVLVVDDGSRDRTSEVAYSHPLARLETPKLSVVRLPFNRGKGAAVRAGVAHANGDHILFFDADLSTSLDHYGAVRLALERGADVVIGSRALPGSRIEVARPPHRALMSVAFNWLARTLTGLDVTDTLCGFKAFERHAAQSLFGILSAERYAFDVELLALAQRMGFRIDEIPVKWRHEDGSSVQPVMHSIASLLELAAIARRLRRRNYLENQDNSPR